MAISPLSLRLSETGNAYYITITDTTDDAADINTLDGKTTIAIDANAVTTLTGTAANINTAYGSMTASQVMKTKTSPSMQHSQRRLFSTRSTDTPQEPSTQTPSTLSPVPP